MIKIDYYRGTHITLLILLEKSCEREAKGTSPKGKHTETYNLYRTQGSKTHLHLPANMISLKKG